MVALPLMSIKMRSLQLSLACYDKEYVVDVQVNVDILECVYGHRL